MDITKNIGILPDILSKNGTEAVKISDDTFEMKTKNGHVAAVVKIGDSVKTAFKNKLKKSLIRAKVNYKKKITAKLKSK